MPSPAESPDPRHAALRIDNATIVTMDASDTILDRAWISIEEGVITAVSSAPPPPQFDGQRIDAAGKVVLPGLVNAHTHLYQVLMRGLFDGLALTPWLAEIYRFGQLVGEDDCEVSGALGGLEALQGGVTTVVEHQFIARGSDLANATLRGMRATGARTVFARTIMDLVDPAPPSAVEEPTAALASIEVLLDQHRESIATHMLTIMTGPNTPGVSSSRELIEAVNVFAAQHGLRQSMHVAESPAVVEMIAQRYGVDGAFTWLAELGVLGSTVLAAHSVTATDPEITLMAESGVSVAHNPVSNMYLGDGIAPVTRMLAAGVNVALGTDGATSNGSQDMFEVMKTTSLLQRLSVGAAAAPRPMQILRMATINGARAVGLDHLIGSIEVGKRADLIILDLHNTHDAAVNDLPSHLVHSVKAADVETVIVDGRLVITARITTGLDESLLCDQASAAAQRLIERARLNTASA